MWKCPKCGRAFKNTNQNHFCKEDNAESIDDYIARQAEEIKPILEKVREVIREAAPNATEKIS
jgi:transposase-like protein